MSTEPDWRRSASCLGTDPGVFFPERGGYDSYGRARRICSECPVVEPCLEAALVGEQGDSGRRAGMFGGLTPDERDALVQARRVLGITA